MTSRNNREGVSLSSGGEIPLIGFGTWELAGDDAYNGVRAALDIGYRHIDTATGYANEDRVGAAVRDSGVDRDEITALGQGPEFLQAGMNGEMKTHADG